MASISTEQLYVNQNIEIKVKRGAYKGTYQSKIEEINENNIKVFPPYKKREIVPLRKNTELEIYFTAKDAAYKFHSRVIERVKGKVELLAITIPEKMIRIQRRNYFRLEVKRDIKYRKVNNDLEAVEKFNKTKTIDLSGGGVKFILKSNLKEGDLIEIKLDIAEISDLKILAEVQQKYDLPNGEAVGVEYKQISQKVRDIIVGWLFDYQRELRKKGLL